MDCGSRIRIGCVTCFTRVRPRRTSQCEITGRRSSPQMALGIGIMTEQSGGELSSSAVWRFEGTSGSYSNRPIVAAKGGNGANGNRIVRGTDGNNASLQKQYRGKYWPDNDQSKRARRKSASHHRHIRSADAVAATLMNSGREDWIGMSMDNIPIPDGVISAITTDNDDGSGSALFATRSRSEGGIAIAGSGREEDRSTFSNETLNQVGSWGIGCSLSLVLCWPGCHNFRLEVSVVNRLKVLTYSKKINFHHGFCAQEVLFQQ